MSSNTETRMGPHLVWLLAPGVIFMAVLGSLAYFLDHRKAGIADLSMQVAAQHAELEAQRNGHEAPSALDPAQVLAECSALIASEPLRVAELSAAAREAGVSLISIRGIDSEETADSTVVERGHQVQANGSYAQIAMFLDGVYALRGLAAIDELSIEPAHDPNNGLQASLEVNWFGLAAPTSGLEGAAQ